MSITRRAFAKINLTLDVRARRPDGYHEIRSIMQTIALHDTVTITPMPDQPSVSLSVAGAEAEGIPAGPSNIVHKAAVRLQKIAAARGFVSGSYPGVGIHLVKRIPAQAGLGGGSSDAAATLLALNALWGLNLSPARLTKLAAALGADVPFFLTGGTALAEGLGELITPLPDFAQTQLLVVVKPPVGVATPAAYAALDSLHQRVPGEFTRRWLQCPTYAPGGNDFEQVVLSQYPEVQAVMDLLRQTTGAADSFKPTLCGSGAAIFCRVRTETEADHLAAMVRNANVGKVWITQTQETIHGN